MTDSLRENVCKTLAVTLLASAFVIGGCKSNPPSPAPDATQSPAQTQPVPAPSTSDASSGGMATAPAPRAKAPAQQVASAAPAPRTIPAQPAPLPPPPPQPPAPLVAPAGTSVIIRTNEALSASHNDVGDIFSGELSEPILARSATIFARGTRVTGTVVAAKGRGRFKGSGALAVELTSIDGIHVQTSEYEKEVQGKGKRTGGLIGGGAGLGALIGGIAGGGKGALIGGLAGAGAGTAGAAYTGNKDVLIPSESVVTFKLAAPLTVRR